MYLPEVCVLRAWLAFSVVVQGDGVKPLTGGPTGMALKVPPPPKELQ